MSDTPKYPTNRDLLEKLEAIEQGTEAAAERRREDFNALLRNRLRTAANKGTFSVPTARTFALHEKEGR